jgi:hypothetical protein
LAYGRALVTNSCFLVINTAFICFILRFLERSSLFIFYLSNICLIAHFETGFILAVSV